MEPVAVEPEGDDAPAPVCEADIPAAYTCAERIGNVPLRLLDAFVALHDGKLRGLDALEGGAAAPRVTLCVEGELRAPGADANPASAGNGNSSLRVQLDVTDWCVDYVRGGVCLITPRAWYRLLRPHPAYAPLFLHTRRKSELAVRAASALDAAPLASYDAVLSRILAPPAALPGGPGAEEGCDSGAAYSEASLLADARFLLSQLTEAVPRTRAATSRPATFVGRLAEVSAALAPPKAAVLESAHPPPRFDASCDEGVLAARAEALLDRMDWRAGDGGGGKRARAASRRGAPPPAEDAAFGLDGATAGDVLLLWDFFAAFADFLRVPPLPLARLVAALCPDSQLAASDAGAASGALLRDLHTALLRVAAGKDLELRAAPLVAVAEGPPGGVPWPQAARAALLAAPRDVVGDDAAAAAAALQDGDYAELSAQQRVALLRGLQAIALEGEAFREQLAMRAEDAEAAAEPLPWEGGGGASASNAVDAARPWDAWAAWAARVAPTAGRPLGADLEGRRYWLLGGAPGWGRLFVEADGARDGSGAGSWACYAWTQLPALAGWLQAGGLKSAAERALLKRLRRLPRPPPAAASAWAITPAAARAAGGGEGPDGYAGLVAPLLRGSSAAAPGAGAAGVEAQVRACVQALLAAVPFWELDGEALARFRLLHAAAAALQAGPALAEVLRDLEELMSAAGALTAEWPPRRTAWRAQAARCATLAAAAMPVAQLQDHLVKDACRLTRDAFGRLMRAEQLVPPFAPADGQTVVVVRTGLQRHCEALGVSVDPALWAALRLTERFRAVCVAFRRGGEGERLHGLHGAWLLLEPARDTLTHLGGGFARGLCVPVAAGLKHLVDAVLDADAFDRCLLRPWAVGDRFRTFFPSGGPEILPGRRPGSWFKGTISRVHLHVELSAAGPGGCERHVDVDPWEAYEVEWDHEKRRERRDFANDRLCPWQLEAPEGLERVQALERRAKEEEQRRFVEQAAHGAAVHRVYAAPEARDPTLDLHTAMMLDDDSD